MKHVVFVGAMGSGKSTIGRRIAVALDRPFLDNDAMLERATGCSAAALAARDGVDALHRAEAAVLLDALRASGRSVIAAAASTITDADVRDTLRDATVIWLRARAGALAARMPGSPTRPFADADAARLVQEQSRQRDALYAAVADATYETDKSDVATVVANVLHGLEET